MEDIEFGDTYDDVQDGVHFSDAVMELIRENSAANPDQRTDTDDTDSGGDGDFWDGENLADIDDATNPYLSG